MEASKGRLKITREPRSRLSGIIVAIGSAWTLTFKRIDKDKERKVKLVSWAGRAPTDSWFLFELEQSKNRSLYYYSRSQIR